MCHPLVAKDKEETPPIFVMTVLMIIRISTLGNGMGEKHISTKELTTPFVLLRFSSYIHIYIYIHISSMLQPDVPKTPANLHKFQAIGNGM